jgi:hypothetical protein
MSTGTERPDLWVSVGKPYNIPRLQASRYRNVPLVRGTIRFTVYHRAVRH